MLKVYELVPEAYRQKFRTWERSSKQTHMDFARELVTHFNQWCSALEVKTFADLCNAMVLEKFKNSLPSNAATYINEHEVKTAAEAVALADKYVLMHKLDFESRACDARDWVKENQLESYCGLWFKVWSFLCCVAVNQHQKSVCGLTSSSCIVHYLYIALGNLPEWDFKFFS